MSLTRQQQQARSRGGRPVGRHGPPQPEAGGPPPPPEEAGDDGHGGRPDHDEHMLRADRDWWAVYAVGEGVAMPVMCWLMGAPDDGSEPDVPVISGVVPDGFGDWERADNLRWFIDYVYRPGGPPTGEEIRAQAAWLVHRFEAHYAEDHEPWEDLDDVREWLEGRQAPS